MSAIDSSLARVSAARQPALSFRTVLNYCVDVVTLLAGVVVFSTALVLFTQFHVGHGTLADSAFGVSRLVWLNTHRLAAVVVLAGVVVHVCLHWPSIVTRVIRTFKRLPGKARPSDLILYFGFALDLLTGFIAWLLLPGSTPLFGPVHLGHLEPARHLCIDLHNFTGLTLLPATIMHIWRHMRWIVNTSHVLVKTRFGQKNADSEKYPQQHYLSRTEGKADYAGQ